MTSDTSVSDTRLYRPPTKQMSGAGPSSNHAFFRSVSFAFAHILSSAAPQHDHHSVSAARSRLRRPREYRPGASRPIVNERSIDVSYLPPFSEAMRLTDHFFATVGTVLPIVSKSVLVTSYESLQEGGYSSKSSIKRSLVNIIFALSHASFGQPESDLYYHRSMICLGKSQLQDASIELSKCLPTLSI